MKTAARMLAKLVRTTSPTSASETEKGFFEALLFYSPSGKPNSNASCYLTGTGTVSFRLQQDAMTHVRGQCPVVIHTSV